MPTDAHVARFEGSKLRWCVVRMGWTEFDLAGACGEPIARVQRTNDGPQCWIYESIARPINSFLAPNTRYFAVCFAEKRMSRQPEMIVDEVIGLSSPPPFLATNTSSAS